MTTPLAGLALVADPRGTQLSVRAQPNARRAGVLGAHDGAVRVGVNAAPEKGKATAAVVAVLAEALGCRGPQVVLVAGATTRQKRFLILGLDPITVRDRLGRACLTSSPSS